MKKGNTSKPKLQIEKRIYLKDLIEKNITEIIQITKNTFNTSQWNKILNTKSNKLSINNIHKQFIDNIWQIVEEKIPIKKKPINPILKSLHKDKALTELEKQHNRLINSLLSILNAI
jgi:hypothetical protein